MPDEHPLIRQSMVALAKDGARGVAVVLTEINSYHGIISPDHFTEMLFDQDAWYGVYGPTWYGDQSEFFCSDEYHESILPLLEKQTWVAMLKILELPDLIPLLEI